MWSSLAVAFQFCLQIPGAGFGNVGAFPLGFGAFPFRMGAFLGGGESIEVFLVGGQVSACGRVPPAQLTLFPAEGQTQDRAVSPEMGFAATDDFHGAVGIAGQDVSGQGDVVIAPS